MVKLLVNADDLGLSESINEGILRSHLDGIVTSTSIVASGRAFREAVKIARDHPALGVGVHLTLVEEDAVCEASRVASLAPQGVLPRTYGALVKGIVGGRIRVDDIERELRAQIERCLAAGLEITHLDSHQHTHTLPVIFARVVRLANEYGIRGIRIPRGAPALRDTSADRFLAKCVLSAMAQGDALLLRSSAVVSTRHFAGLFESGRLSEASLLRIVSGLKGGSTELVCHPGCDDPSPRYAKWNERRQLELASLTSRRVKETIQDLGIELVNYRQL